MPSNNLFSTYGATKQAEITTKLMELFKGNERFHGAGNVKGSIFDEEKRKWKPGHPRFEHRTLVEADWHAHLSGERFIGISPLQDDGTVWFACMDVDKIGNDDSYDFDYANEMWKIKASKFPLTVYRTKSGGLRPTIFFSEPVEAELAIKRLKQMAAHLGYAGCEIFPKQTKINAAEGDCPNWIYLPYGPHPEGMFPEQCCMNESGNAMDLYESVVYAMKRRITKQQFFDLFVEEFKARANGKANGKSHPKGKWITPAIDESYDLTIKTMFWDGPVCLFYIALDKCKDNQHYFLLNCCMFFRRKYSENWDEALTWVNFNVLRPVGDREKLDAMIKDFKSKGERPYEYTCKTEPICSRCHAHACKTRAYGVGRGNGIDQFDWGMVIVDREPRIFFINVGDHRISLSANELLTQQKYKEKCVAYGVPFPHTMKRDEWENLVNKNIEDAQHVEPPQLLRTNAAEYAALERFFGANIPTMVRARGEEYLSGRIGDYVRVKMKEERIYFKIESLQLFCMKSLMFRRSDEDALIMFLDKEAEFHPRNELRDWFRSTYSMRFNQFDPGFIDKCLHPDQEDGDE